MNLSDFIQKSKAPPKQTKNSSDQLSAILNSRPANLRSANLISVNSSEEQTKSSVESTLQKLERTLSKESSFEVRNPEEFLPTLEKKLKFVQNASQVIKSLAFTQRSIELINNPSTRYHRNKALSLIRISDTPVEFEFKSRKNSIAQGNLRVTRKRPKIKEGYEFELE